MNPKADPQELTNEAGELLNAALKALNDLSVYFQKHEDLERMYQANSALHITWEIK